MLSRRSQFILIALAALLAVLCLKSTTRKAAVSEGPATVARTRPLTARLVPGASSGPSSRATHGRGVLRNRETADSRLPFVFRPSSDEQADAIRAWAEARGLSSRYLPPLHLLRMSLTERELLDLLHDFPDASREYFQDEVLHLPSIPAKAGGSEAGLPFGASYLSFLGLDATDTNRGHGVTVAIIDTGILPHGDLANLDLTVLSATGDLLSDGQYRADVHGTAIASIIAGSHGIAPAASILSFPIIDDEGSASLFDLASAIVTATDQGARLISVSLGGESASQTLQEAIDYAWDNGTLVIASAGNDGFQQIAFPAAFGNTIAVGAIDAAGQHMAFSNSWEQLDVVAPGVALRAAGEDNGWIDFSGTSAAVPCVTGVLACYLAENPYSQPEETSAALAASCLDAGTAGRDIETGAGIIDGWHLMNLDQPGLTDAALFSLVIDDTQKENQITLLANAQNTGTATIPSLTVTTVVNGQTSSQTFENIRPGQSLTAEMAVDISQYVSGQKIPVTSTVSLPDNSLDLRPGNQTCSATLVVQ